MTDDETALRELLTKGTDASLLREMIVASPHRVIRVKS
jgi:hypothetical protein